MPTIKGLTERDVRILKEVIRREASRVRNVQNRVHVDSSFSDQSTDAYMVRSPAGGIPALTGDVPGWADCDVYLGVHTSVVPEERELRRAGFSVRVFNYSSAAVEESEWVFAKKDKYGVWYADNIGASSASSASVCLEGIAQSIDAASDADVLDGTWIDAGGTSDDIVLSQDATVVIWAALDFYGNNGAVSGDVYEGALSVNGARHTKTAFATLTGPMDRVTANNHWLLSLAAGTHSVKLQARRQDGSGTAVLKADGTGWVAHSETLVCDDFNATGTGTGTGTGTDDDVDFHQCGFAVFPTYRYRCDTDGNLNEYQVDVRVEWDEDGCLSQTVSEEDYVRTVACCDPSCAPDTGTGTGDGGGGESTGTGTVEESCGSCTVMARYWNMTVAGVANSSCSHCDKYNGSFRLAHSSGCTFGSEEAEESLCGLECIPGCSVWSMTHTGVRWELKPAAGVMPFEDTVTYFCEDVDFDCFGTNTFLLDTTNSFCSGWPTSVEVAAE